MSLSAAPGVAVALNCRLHTINAFYFFFFLEKKKLFSRSPRTRCECSCVWSVYSDTMQQQQQSDSTPSFGHSTQKKQECSGFKASPGVAAAHRGRGGSGGVTWCRRAASLHICSRQQEDIVFFFLSFSFILSFCCCFKQSAMAYMVCCGPEIRRRKLNNVFLFFKGEGHAWLITE